MAHHAASKIARQWLNRKYHKYMDTEVFADRLELEDNIERGFVRLTINIFLFLLIIAALSLGTPPTEQLAAKSMLTKALDLDQSATSFLSIQTIEALRDFLPGLSESIKLFSASSVTVDGRNLLTERTEFKGPITIFEFVPQMSEPAWTLSAWVERLPAG